jgi:hypothetical protein
MFKVIIRNSLVLLVLMTLLASYAEAQKRRKAAVKSDSAATVEINQAVDKVSLQLMNVARFIYVLGGVAKELETIDQEAKKGQLSKAIIDKNEEFKQKVIKSIRDLRIGLAALEAEFRANPKLSPYISSLIGVTDDCNFAEEQAASGDFIQSGRTLLMVIEKLTNTLAAMAKK